MTIGGRSLPATPTVRFSPRRSQFASSGAEPLCFVETFTDGFAGGAGDIDAAAWNVDAGSPAGLELDGSGHLIVTTVSAQGIYDHGFYATLAGHHNFQVDADVAAWTLAAGGGGAYHEIYLLARHAGAGPGGTAYILLNVYEGVGNLATGPSWDLYGPSGFITGASGAAPGPGDTVTLLVVDDAVSGQLNGVDMVTASGVALTDGGYGGIALGRQTNGGGTSSLQIDSFTIQNLC